MIGIWLSKTWGWLLLAGAVIAGLFAVRQSGKMAGKQEAKAQQAEADAKSREVARDVDRKIAQMDTDAMRQRAADKWVRKP